MSKLTETIGLSCRADLYIRRWLRMYTTLRQTVSTCWLLVEGGFHHKVTIFALSWHLIFKDRCPLGLRSKPRQLPRVGNSMSTADIGSVVASIETIAAECTICSDAVPRGSIGSYQARGRRKFFNDFSRACARTRARGAANRVVIRTGPVARFHAIWQRHSFSA